MLLKVFPFQGKFPNSAYWFNQMYYGNNSAFKRSRAGRGLHFPGSILNIKGFMEANTYHSILNISVTPTRFVMLLIYVVSVIDSLTPNE